MMILSRIKLNCLIGWESFEQLHLFASKEAFACLPHFLLSESLSRLSVLRLYTVILKNTTGDFSITHSLCRQRISHWILTCLPFIRGLWSTQFNVIRKCRDHLQATRVFDVLTFISSHWNRIYFSSTFS